MPEITYKLELNHKLNKDRTRTLFLRITQSRVIKRIKVLSIEDKHYNLAEADIGKGNWIKRSHPDYRTYNKKIREMLSQIAVLAGDSDSTLNNVLSGMKGEDSQSFLFFADKVTGQLEHEHYNNYEQYRTCINKLRRYMNGRDLLFKDITVSFLRAYESHLLSIGNGKTTRYNNFKIIRAIYYRAIKEDYAGETKNPFFIFKISPGKAHRAKLTDEEIGQIEALDLPPHTFIWNARNYYLFTYYLAGMRVRDLMMLKWWNVLGGRAGYISSKKQKDMSVKLNDKALAIVELYRTPDAKPTDFVFPIMRQGKDYSDQKVLRKDFRSLLTAINRNLKRIATLAGIDKNVSMHTSRHSFATKAWNKTKDIRAVQQLLGHEKISVTEGYLKSLGLNELDEAMDDIFGE